MPPLSESKLKLSDYLRQLKVTQDYILEQTLRAQVHKASPWDLYSDDCMRGGLNKQLIDGHIRFALKEYRFSHDFDLRHAGTIMLACGAVLVRLDEDGIWDCEDPEIIRDFRFKHGRPVYVEICYEHQEPRADGTMETWEYEAIYFLDGKQAKKKWRDSLAGTPDEERDDYTSENLDVFPYKGVEWVTRHSLLSGSVPDIIRHSELLEEIEQENRNKSRMALHYRGVSGFANSVEEQKAEGRVIMGKDGDAFYPDTNPGGTVPMFEELARLEQLIRDNTGYVKVMALHNASAVSREYEYWPLESQALSIRARLKKLAVELYDHSDLWFPPLLQLSPQEVQVELLNLQTLATINAVSPQELRERQRLIMRFHAESGND